MTAEPPPANRPSVAIETHGCKLNQADSQLLARRFLEAGYRLVASDDPADVYVVNSCTVTHVADRKARHALRAARRRNPQATIVATGCYAQRSPEALGRLEEVDLIMGNTQKASLVAKVMEWRRDAPVPCATGSDTDPITLSALRTRAMVKIQEGCDQVCAYCIVPKVRGRERSIPPDEIIAGISHQVAQGYNEVVLTGTQLGSYGFEIPDITLARLLERILAETNVARVRVSSLQPQEISPRLLSLWSDPRLCPHFHMPLQSGSDRVLKRMRRRYTSRIYSDAANITRQRVPDVSITADVIVGFPGETEEDFQQTYALCDRIGFAAMHIFPYSPRPGTSAAHFEGKVGQELKSRRVQLLLSLARARAFDFRTAFMGKVRPVLWEGQDEYEGSTMWSGLTDNYIRVACLSPRRLTNQITSARLSTQSGDVVRAEVL